MAGENAGTYLVKAGLLTTLGAIDNVFKKGKLFTGLKKKVRCKKGFEYRLLA